MLEQSWAHVTARIFSVSGRINKAANVASCLNCACGKEAQELRRGPTRRSQKSLVFPTPKSGAAVSIKIASGSGLA